jgi:hypothetical protein
MRSSLLLSAVLLATPALAIERFDPAPSATSLPQPLARSFSAAQPVRMASGSRNGLSWTAVNTVIGQRPTSNVGPPPNNTIGGGDPLYRPSANKAGVVALIMEYANGDRFICSGSLLPNGRSIATAAHCVSDGFGTANPVKTTAHFFAGDPDVRTPDQVGGVAIEVIRYDVHPGYTGEVIDQNDIAVLGLKVTAPANVPRYELYTPASTTASTGLTGMTFNVAGYGARSTVGGAAGTTAPAGARTGFLREGNNIYDYAWGNGLFQGFFTDRDTSGQFAGQNFFGFAEVEYSFVSDFDNGLRAQDQSRRIANGLGLGLIGNANFDNAGIGTLGLNQLGDLNPREVGIAGGDSGGPGFINGRLASINSYGLTFGGAFGDFGGGLNAGWGEFSGYVPVFIHEDFINAAQAIPEPSSWAMLITGFGLAGAMQRRRRRALA